MKKWSAYLVAAAFLAGAATSIFAVEKPDADAKALFESKCSACHSIDRPKSKRKTAAEWEKTVMRMKNVNGCPITDEEAKTIITYLVNNYGEKK